MSGFENRYRPARVGGREVILFDNSGIGRSSGKVPQTIAGMAEHALTFLDGLGLKNCDVLGFSLGGMVAQQMVQERPSIFRRMILVGTNMLIGIVVGIVVVAASIYATGFTKKLLSPFGSTTEYKSSESTAAPELATGNWINSDPLKLRDLRGRVVLIEFWTFGCYNCRNTLPFVKSWDDRYRGKGFTVIGVHSPEFDEERNVETVRRQVASLGIRYPIVTDNDYQTWAAYHVEAWPTIFL